MHFDFFVPLLNSRKRHGWLDSAAANQDHYDGRTSFSPLHREDQVEESHYPVVLRGADAVGEMLQLVARLVLSYALFSSS